MICDNPKCQYHQPMVSPDPHCCRVMGPVTPNGEQMVILVERHPYANRWGQIKFYLCGTCHAAVEMIKR